MATRNERRGFHVEATSQTRGTEEIEKGRVGEVLQQFQVHEDTSLAYQLQSKEIEHHVSRNKEQRRSVRDNIKTAKETYLEEVKNAGVLPETSVAEIEQKQWLAEELHRRVEEQEHVAKTRTERQRREDEEIALKVQRDEEKRLRYFEHKRIKRIAEDEEEYRRLRRIMKELESAEISEHMDDDVYRHGEFQGEEDKDLIVQLPKTNEIITLADGTVIDAKHNEVQTEEQKKQHMQRRDEELAKLLQEQEDHKIEKQRNLHQDYRKAIELQDREIAKHLQRQEKAKADKRREKMRRGQSLPERDELLSGQRHLPTYHEAIGVDDVEREECHHQPNGRHQAPSNSDPNRRSATIDEEDEGILRAGNEEQCDLVWVPRDDSERNTTGSHSEPIKTEPARNDNEPGSHFDNIAETLDPTFQRISRRSLPEEHDDKQSGNKTAPIVPPLKRKAFKEKGKRDKDKDCKQQ